VRDPDSATLHRAHARWVTGEIGLIDFTEEILHYLEPHHTIELIDENGSKSFIQVCFRCDDTQWDGTSGLPPKDFQKVFQGFIEQHGFQADRDWVELAKDQAQ
jgi:hypothetical protein